MKTTSNAFPAPMAAPITMATPIWNPAPSSGMNVMPNVSLVTAPQSNWNNPFVTAPAIAQQAIFNQAMQPMRPVQPQMRPTTTTNSNNPFGF